MNKFIANFILGWYELATFKKYNCTFVTVDKEVHINGMYKWVKTSNLICSGEDYLMSATRDSNYLKDSNGIVYPIENVVSVEWTKTDEKVLVNKTDRFQTFFTNEEISKLEKLTDKVYKAVK